jgi:hypothetical protein
MQEIIQVSKKEAEKVLDEVDKLVILAEKHAEEAGSCFLDLSFLLMQVKSGALWTERGFRHEHEYIEKVFPQSRAQYYRLIRCATNLQGYERKKLKEWGIAKCEGLTRLHIHFEGSVPAEWFEYLEKDGKETFLRRIREYFDSLDDTKETKEIVENKEKPSPETEDNFITIRIFGNDINTFNVAMERSGLELGSDKSISYRIMMVLNDYLAGFTEDGKGRVQGKNSYILTSIEGLVKQLDFKETDLSERLIGIVARGVEQNAAT